jgi:hypothetical protein
MGEGGRERVLGGDSEFVDRRQRGALCSVYAILEKCRYIYLPPPKMKSTSTKEPLLLSATLWNEI